VIEPYLRRYERYPFRYRDITKEFALALHLFVILVFSFKRFLPLLFLHRVV
jgi:hypothetical protein